MTKQEIQALISAAIAGQGSAIDAGGVLPRILNGILDLIPEGSGAPKVTINGQDYDLDAIVMGEHGGNMIQPVPSEGSAALNVGVIQPDWGQENDDEPDFIRNKPKGVLVVSAEYIGSDYELDVPNDTITGWVQNGGIVMVYIMPGGDYLESYSVPKFFYADDLGTWYMDVPVYDAVEGWKEKQFDLSSTQGE